MKRKTVRRKRQPRKTRKHKGGVKLGQGMFGKVYSPGMLCKGTPVEVTKAFKPDDDYFPHDKALETIKNLKLISKKLEVIDSGHKFFLYPEFCDEEPTLSDENKKDGLTIYDIPISYNMKKADISLEEKYNSEIKRGIFIVNDILYTEDQEDKNTKEVIAEKTAQYRKEAEQLTDLFIPVFKNVKSLVQKLHSVNIIHNDLNTGNIMIMKDGSYRLIDFDMSEMKEGITDKEKQEELKYFINSLLGGWDIVYPDLYTKIMNS